MKLIPFQKDISLGDRASPALAALARRSTASRADPQRVALAARTLVNGALRIRRGGDGIYGDAPARPVTKPAEAIGAWVDSLSGEAAAANEERPFHRDAELREALAAAAEEVDEATRAVPGAAGLRDALLGDAAEALKIKKPSTALPWVVAGVLGGALAGTLLGIFLSRRRLR